MPLHFTPIRLAVAAADAPADGMTLAAFAPNYRASDDTKLAHFPFLKTLEQFDFSAQPSINERHVKELATSRFVAHGENVLLCRPSSGHAAWPTRSLNSAEHLRRA